MQTLIERITSRPRVRNSDFLIQDDDDDGNPMSLLAMRLSFAKARKLAGVSFQFRDLRAKTATDTGDLAHSQKLLGHRKKERSRRTDLIRQPLT